MAKLKTGRHTSALKEARKSKKRTKRNTAIKSRIKSSIKKIEMAVRDNNTESAFENLATTFSYLDKATKKNTIHPKSASNQKIRLSKLVSKIKK
ncbi:MAG: 30S ribosomal protein S20 [Endomicrobium sp.]|jgi:small subunit ribosomal protein S20|nr:30S ribosomal protein S20 [Endomicrobium sp.]